MNTIDHFYGMNIHENSDTDSQGDSYDPDESDHAAHSSHDLDSLHSSHDSDSSHSSHDSALSHSSDHSYDSDVPFHHYFPDGLQVPLETRALHDQMIFGFMQALHDKGREGGYWQRVEIELQGIMHRILQGLPTEHNEENDMQDIGILTRQNRRYLDFYKQYEPYVLGFIRRYFDDNGIGREETAQMLFHHYSGGDHFYLQHDGLSDFGVRVDDPSVEDTTG